MCVTEPSTSTQKHVSTTQASATAPDNLKRKRSYSPETLNINSEKC